jgi:uncharacterized LabA/DUF88 family protein
MPLLPFSSQAENNQAKLAVLIDADNTQPAIIEGLLDEVAKYGVASVKRIYGDWTNTHLRSWKDRLLANAIQPMQQFSYTTGKNSTDSFMIIDAMDLLYTEKLDGFCIVSSDSDFTRLAARLRESGCTVYGFGAAKTPEAFVKGCDKFIYTEILLYSQEESDEDEDKPKTKSRREFKADRKLLKLLRDVVDNLADESGWAYLGGVGQKINNRYSEFDPRNYGFKKLGDLFRAIPQFFETEERHQEGGTGRQVYIRWKKKR